MFTIQFVATVLAAASLVAAAPHSSSEQCDTGSMQCCQSVQPAGSAPSSTTDASSGLISVLLSNLNVPVGITCTPISVVGVLAGDSGCSASPVCCDSTQSSDDGSGSLVGINCLPISISL